MSMGWVADHGDGVEFSAYVEYDEPGPFAFVNGPRSVDASEAVAWACHRARQVIIRVGDTHYSAGPDPVKRFPRWTPPEGALPKQEDAPTRDTTAWRVEAGTGWYRADRLAVARRLAETLRRDPRASDVASVLKEVGFAVTFTVLAPSMLVADEAASRVVRKAWAATGIEAVPGDDYDCSSIQVVPRDRVADWSP